METNKILNKIYISLWIVIALLFFNTVILLVVNGDKKETTQKDNTIANTDYDVSSFESIDPSDFGKVMARNKLQVIYIGRASCGYCVQFLPIIKKAQQEFGYKTVYLDITKVTTEEQQKEILKYDNDEQFLAQKFGSTPMVLLAKDGKLVDTWVGYAEYDTYKEFLTKNKIGG